jgi:signal transduction histidine kinase/CheY-like chemotaxis protein/HPt (histidine-containing phosphotransfer) domain-containing protein
LESKWAVRQSTISGIILAIFFFIAVMLGWSILYMNSSIKAEQNAEKRRTEFKQLGINLANASDYLTDEARKFAVTREIKHLQRYWEEINVTRTRDKVISRLQELESPKEELELLAEAKKYSDALVETERRSMRLAMEALGENESNMVPEIATFKLSNEDKELNRDNKLIKAIQIMNDVRYDGDKKNIMEPIAKFQRTMNSRLEAELESARKGTTRATVLQAVLAFVIILAIAILIRMLFMQVTFPIRNYTLMLRDFSFDNEGFSLTPQGTMELRMLAKNFNDLYESFRGELVRRRSAEETMKTAKDEADYANKAKSEFLANMSHEIRTPLNSVIGYQYLLKNTRLLPKQMEYSENIGMAAKNLLDIINEILDFSKIEAGRMVLDEVDFNLDSMLKELCIIVGMEAKRKGIDLEFHINPDVPRFLRGDITRLKQIILNLLSNGIKFTHEGSIFIGVELYEKEKNHVFIKFHVTDTGIGISDEQKKSLFQVFTQGDASTSRKYGGTGLGLAICKRIVELMRGEISVESQVGIGSRFSFTVKLEIVDSISQSNEGINPKITAELFKNKRILLVEDSAINLQMTKEILENIGIETDTADSGPEAIRMVGRNKYEAVLMDIRMPGMDGYEATKRIRESEGKASVPIVALTADAVEGVAQKAREAGMDGYLTKPLEPIKLLEILTGIMVDGEKEHNEGHYSYKTNKDDINNDNTSKNNISKYNSVDFEGAIKRIGGKEYKYIGILKNFIENHNEDEIKIKDLISSGKIQELKEFVHTLKGSAANIGALSLKDKLVNLENELFNGNEDEVQSIVSDFKIEIKGIYEWAAQYIESFDTRACRSKEEMGRIDLADIREDLDMLHKLLDMGDSDAKSLFEKRMGYLSNILEMEDYNELRKQIISYSFQEAAVSVDRIIDRIEDRKI